MAANHRRKSDSPARPSPHFSAIVLEFPIPQHKLMIPKKSAMKFGMELSENAMLVIPDGRYWKVELKRDGEKIWFCDGLKGFLDYYSVEYFYNLHFSYEGNSVFRVCICDETGSEIDYLCASPSENVSDQPKLDIVEMLDTNPNHFDGLVCKLEDIDVGDDQRVEILGIEARVENLVSRRKSGRSRKRIKRSIFSVSYQTRSRSRKTEVKESGIAENSELGKPKYNSYVRVKHKKEEEEEEDVEMISPKYVNHVASARPVILSKETEKAIRVAKTRKLKNPSFMFILTSYYIKQGWATVPVDFVKKHLNFRFEDIQLQAYKGKKKWPARCYHVYKEGSVLSKRIGKGWALFSADKKLKEGDVCVFELIKKGRKEATLRVWIYRAADYAK